MNDEETRPEPQTWRAEPAPRFRCVCGTEDMVTRERDGTLIDKIRCPGCERIWERVTDLKLSVPAWSNRQTAIMREGAGPPVGEEPPLVVEDAPSTPHIKCVCGKHLQTRMRNGEPWHYIRCIGSMWPPTPDDDTGCWRTWRLSDSSDGVRRVWIGFGSNGQRPWNPVRHEQRAPNPWRQR